MNNSYVNCFNNLISKLLTVDKGVYTCQLSKRIYNILFSDQDASKYMFYDFFSNIDSYDKNEIITNVLSIVINKCNIIINCVDDKKIKKLYNVIDKKENRHMLFEIYNYTIYGTTSGLSSEIINELSNLNRFELIALKSIILNIMKYNTIDIKNNIDDLISNKESFLTNIKYYEKNIIQLLDFYIPIYSDLSNFTCYGIFDVKDSTNVFFLIDLIREKLKKSKCFDDIFTTNLFSKEKYLHVMNYDYLINAGLGFFDSDDVEFKKTLKLILDGGIFDNETIKYIYTCYKSFSELTSLDDRIKCIKEISKDDNYAYNFIARYDIAKYEIKQKKKVAFGLK